MANRTPLVLTNGKLQVLQSTDTLAVVGITNSGSYTQTGTATNTFNGSTNVNGTLTALTFSVTGINEQSGIRIFTLATGSITAAAGYTQTGTSPNTFTGDYIQGTKLLFSTTAPTISSGFGTSPSIVNSNGTTCFSINVGTGGTASSGVITLPSATTNWNISICNPITGSGTFTQQSAHTATSVTLTNYTIATDVAVAWPAGYILECIAIAK